MEPSELKAIQEQIKFDGPAMSVSLGIAYEQYRRYLYGAAEIPEEVARAAQELVIIEQQFDVSRDREYCRFLDHHYPQGIVSECVEVEP